MVLVPVATAGVASVLYTFSRTVKSSWAEVKAHSVWLLYTRKGRDVGEAGKATPPPSHNINSPAPKRAGGGGQGHRNIYIYTFIYTIWLLLKVRFCQHFKLWAHQIPPSSGGIGH